MDERVNAVNRKVFFISDSAMNTHKCGWDDEHIEVPERLEKVLTYLKGEQSNVLGECEVLQSSSAKLDDIRLVHDANYIETLSKTRHMNSEELESYCSGFEDVYANEHTYKACLLSTGCALEAMRAVIAERDRFASAFAAIRPPGHHASRNMACGFCFFNNVAICAKKARQMGMRRVLIVDWDVHAAQGTQYCIEDDPNIKLISIHRYEYGKFWPQLPESAIQHSYANTVNMTLNKTGFGDAEYISFMSHLVVPIISDFQPSLILVSCGFDASLGDPEGGMTVTPGGYQWMTHILVSHAIKLRAPLCMLLEGGYFIETLPMNVEFCVKALLGKSLPPVPLGLCDSVFLNSLHSAAIHYGSHFPSLQLFADVAKTIRQFRGVKPVELDNVEYKGIREFSLPYPTQGNYHRLPDDVVKSVCKKVSSIIASYVNRHEQRKLLLCLNSFHDETDEAIVVNIDGASSIEIVEKFLHMHVCEPSWGVYEDISIEKSWFSPKNSLTRTEFTSAAYDATLIGICVALLQIFEKGFAKNLEHILLFDA